MTDLLPDLRSLLASQPSGSGAHATLERAVAELVHLYRQRDDLQRRGTELITENRDLRAQVAGNPAVRVKRFGDPGLPLPAYATEGAAGLDLRADLSLLTVLPIGAVRAGSVLTLYPGARLRIPCGFGFEIPAGWEGQVRGRSGWTERGVCVSTGTVDCDFRGVVGIHVENRSVEPVEIKHADRIAQLVIAQAPQARLEEVEELSASARGANGFGHTGVR